MEKRYRVERGAIENAVFLGEHMVYQEDYVGGEQVIAGRSAQSVCDALNDARDAQLAAANAEIDRLTRELAEARAKLGKICIDGGYNVCARCGDLMRDEA